MRHEHRLVVESWQCDANGHVNNAVYLNFLESARVAFLRDAGTSYRQLREQGFGLVVVKVCIEYRSEAFMEDPLVVVTEPLRKRLIGGVFHQAVYLDAAGARKLVADAEVTWVCVDAHKRPVRLPPFLDARMLEPAAEGGQP
ncbi:MAG TPA: thioesterase family protein [Spirochaetia bacterium]|nr:thioesterase family protein [Spirochaetia bacterium]